jgi:hypothetical protein
MCFVTFRFVFDGDPGIKLTIIGAFELPDTFEGDRYIGSKFAYALVDIARIVDVVFIIETF